MTDIVQRLRQHAKEYAAGTEMIAAAKGPGYGGLKPEQTTEWQAADEIERLRTALREIVRILDEELHGTSGTRLANIARAAIAKATTPEGK